MPLEIHTASRLVRDDVLAAYEHRSSSYSCGYARRRSGRVPTAQPIEWPARREVGLSEPETLILFCGHSFKRKGLDRAVVALGKMREPAQLVIVGEDDPAPYLALAKRARRS